MKNILLTRPHEHSRELAELLEKAGFSAFIEPLFVKKNSVTKRNQGKISAVIITSANACDAVMDFGFSKDVKIFSVGKKTAKKLITHGFTNIITPPENSANLSKI